VTKIAPTLRASPNPLPASRWRGKTTISWNSVDEKIYVSVNGSDELLFAARPVIRKMRIGSMRVPVTSSASTRQTIRSFSPKFSLPEQHNNQGDASWSANRIVPPSGCRISLGPLSTTIRSKRMATPAVATIMIANFCNNFTCHAPSRP